MNKGMKAGIIIPIVCATGAALALSAAVVFGSVAAPAEPPPANSSTTPCDVRPDAKQNPCPSQP